ncbi:hypothetical protein FACS1894147_07230 [Spirochaetia bacterium]|nr:hypothetical protein FACS1894147_07230 [Spirochaetia bacterium]
MGAYYYLVSQLPSLIYGQVAPLSSSAFRDLARPLLDSGDAALLDFCSLDPQPFKAADDGPAYAEHSIASGSEFIDRWREWERALRLNLARVRSVKGKREGAAPVEPPLFPADAAAAAARAVAAESPLEAELILDKARWDAIEGLQGINYFDRNTIYAYLLKLLLLERGAAFEVENGFTEYKSLYAAILERVQTPMGEAK